MISGLTNEKVSYRTRYLHFPSTLTESVPTISTPTLHVIKIRFNNVFKSEKLLFAGISVLLSLLSLLIGYGLYSMYKGVLAEDIIENSSYEQLQAISAEDSGASVMNKSGFFSGLSGSNEGGNYFAYNDGGGIDPNSLLLASGEKQQQQKTDKKEVLTSKKAVIDIEENAVVNPFLPITEVKQNSAKKVTKPNPNYILPPTSVSEDSTASLLLSTVISGIMFDTYSPSAIVRISDTDFLVKKGDLIHGFKVLNITPKTVTLKLGKNVYEAPVGIILASLPTTNNTSTVNLNNRFGGNNSDRVRR